MRSRLIRALAFAAVVAGTLTGGLLTLAGLRSTRELSVGTVRLFIEPGHRGALDIYVPIVDWGLRFRAVRFPARVRADVSSLDRAAVARVASGGTLPVARLRAEARRAIASFLRLLLVVALAASLGLGSLTALALRRAGGIRLRWLLGTAGATAAAFVVVLVVLLPPRGRIDAPVYYAHGADVPRALRAFEDATRAGNQLSQELDAQLVGLARLVGAPATRTPLRGLPRVLVASDLHNNVLAFPTLQSAADGSPIFFVGDLTDSGSPVEATLTQRIVDAGRPLVFVSGNHDSDTLERRLARAGAIVLGTRGRLLADGRRGSIIQRIAGLRVAGYDDPFERRQAEGYRAVLDPTPTIEQQKDFAGWLAPLVGNVDVVMVHEPRVAQLAIEELRAAPPKQPLTILVGHTHKQSLSTSPNLVVLNPGTAGAGGTGNLEEHATIGLGIFTFRARPSFQPLAADLVAIDPGNGAATARRTRLDAPSSG